jgi:hypothetical protein
MYAEKIMLYFKNNMRDINIVCKEAADCVLFNNFYREAVRLLWGFEGISSFDFTGRRAK